MSRVTCTRRFCVDAGHRVHKHESKCAHLHGHSYKIHVTVSAPQLDPLGRVVDFGLLKTIVGRWLEERWDHGFIVGEEDRDLITALRAVPGVKQKLYIMPFNPTAENMARYLVNTICPSLFAGTSLHATCVVVEETENCSAAANADIQHSWEA